MLNTHDGLVIQAELNTREAVEKVIIDAFNIPLKVRTHTVVVPLELGWAPNFNDMKDEHLHYYR